MAHPNILQPKHRLSRREFLRLATLSGIAAVGAACVPKGAPLPPVAPPAVPANESRLELKDIIDSKVKATVAAIQAAFTPQPPVAKASADRLSAPVGVDLNPTFDAARTSNPGANASFDTRLKWLNGVIQGVDNATGTNAERWNAAGQRDFGTASLVWMQEANRPACEQGFLPIPGYTVNGMEYGFYLASGKQRVTNGGASVSILPENLVPVFNGARASMPGATASFDTRLKWLNGVIQCVDNATGTGAARWEEKDAGTRDFGTASLVWMQEANRPACEQGFLPLPGYTVNKGEYGLYIVSGKQRVTNGGASYSLIK